MKQQHTYRLVPGLLTLLLNGYVIFAWAGEADVVDADITCNANNTCSFRVSVQHADAGWDHYANKWEVISMEGEVLGTRTLHHPHVDEQPFTRSLSGVHIPAGIRQVRIRAYDSVHESGGREMVLDIKPW